MVDNPLQKRLRDLQYTIWRYAPLLWRFPETRKNIFRVVWRRPLLIIKWLLVIAGIIVVPIILVKFILVGYSLPFTGFNGERVPNLQQYQPSKTLWDWLQLLIIPAVLAVGVTIFNRLLNERSRDIATDQQQETALQNYLKEMSKLLITSKLRDSASGSLERDIAHARTLTVLPGLDPLRKGRVLRFLYETGLIYKENTIVDLRGANFSNLRIHETKLSSDYLQMTGCRLSLRNANLQGAIFRDASLEQIDLRDACLDEAYISQADLNGTWLCQASMELTKLHGTNLHGACLRGAQMRGAQLRGAYLREADLRKVNLQEADLSAADLRGANLTAAQMQGTRLCDANITEEQRKIAETSGARFKQCKDTAQTFDPPADALDTLDHDCNDAE